MTRISQFISSTLLIYLLLGFSQTAFSQIGVKRLPDLTKRFCVINSNKKFRSGNVQRYALTYYTKNQYGQNVMASGLVAIPKRVSSQPSTLFYLHGTASGKKNAPSMNSFESRWVGCKVLKQNEILVAPDYLGLGYGQGHHPYMVKDITTSASIDFYDVARRWLMQSFGIYLNPNTTIAGYSQGCLLYTSDAADE